jgi:SAM-dependent methyltransferase
VSRFPVEYDRVAAQWYDPAYALLRDCAGDTAFYHALAHEAGGPILELGCGTGRVLLPIARDGFDCVGLDASPAMLAVLREKHPPPNLRLVQARMQDFDLSPARFGLIFSAFRPLQHLYTVADQLACLACVRRHLAPGAPFAFDVFAPDPARLAAEEEPWTEDARFESDGEEVVREVSITRDLGTQTQTVRMRYRRRRGTTVTHEATEVFRMRWYWRYELEHLLARAGFRELVLYGGFDRRPFDHASAETVIVAR